MITIYLYPESWSVGNAWITNHAKACAAAAKPCLLDLFWQYGDALS